MSYFCETAPLSIEVLVRPVLSLIRAGSVAANVDPEEPGLSAVFRRYAHYVGAITLRILGQRDEVDDIVQDVFVEAAKGLDQLREPEAVRAWLASVTVRLCTRRLRLHKFRRWASLDGHPRYEALEAPGASPEQRVLLIQIYRALDAAPIHARIAWVLRFVDGESLETIAARCQCSIATVKRRVALAQLHVEEALGS